jgi:hypothetical protein
MTYICLDCGHIFEEGEEARWSESRGEFWGVASYENMSGCPKCKGNYAKASSCKKCGSAHLEDELNGGVCDDCINEYRKDFDACYKMALCEQTEIKINSLLATLFCESDIEQILIEHIKKNFPNIDCSEYIDSDIYWFGEQIAKEVS